MLVCAFVAAAAIVGSAQGVRKIDVSKLGPQVGAKVPDFNLADQQGKKRTLQSVMGPNGAMIVFYRSADWCPYCKTQLLELQSQYDSLRKDGLGLVGISYDSQDILAAFSRQHGITFPLLSDVGSETIERYGILNTVAEEGLGPNGNDPDVIAQVKPRAVEILILHYEHDYSDAQIAHMLGTSRGTIAVTLYRTRARLKKLLSRAIPETQS